MYWFNPVYNKSPKGPSQKDKEVTYTLKIAKVINSTSAVFNYCYDFESDKKVVMNKRDCGDCVEYAVTVNFDRPGLYWYFFEVYQGEHKFYLQKTASFDVEPTGYLQNKFQQLVYEKTSKVDPSYQGGVMYHIFVDRFRKEGKVTPRFDLVLRDDWGGEITKNSTDFLKINKECFGGNLKGIEKKLDYLKSLNVSTLYLSPIFEANSYHKYNTADYLKIDSMFGSEKDFASLVKRAKEQDINIILDGVFNHVGSDSVYFNKYSNYKEVGAFQGKKSKYFNWFEFDEYPNKYKTWWGIESLPQIKKGNQSFANFISNKNGVIDKYMKLGILGFRLDVVDELLQKSLKPICASIKRNKKDALILGEVWEDASNKIAYDERKKYFLGNELDSVMNYPIKDAIINYVTTKNCENLKNTLYLIKDHYPKDVQDNLMNILGTHDTSRILSVLLSKTNNDEAQAIKLLKIATLLQFAVMGVPCVFYGDEQGLKGEGAPFCRVCFPWNNQNKSLKNWYIFLGNLRKNKVFKKGELNILLANNNVFGFERVEGKNKIVVYTNCSENTQTIDVGEKLTNYVTKKTSNKKITLQPYGFAILEK